MKKSSVSVIGQGFVGGSLTTVLSERGLDVYVYDKTGKVAKGGKTGCLSDFRLPSSVSQLVAFCEKRKINDENHCAELDSTFMGVYFVCVPTPMKETGECDTSIVEEVLDELSKCPGKRIAVVKSTVPPGTTSGWNKKYEGTGLRVVFNPEFLTEANALDDMRQQNRIILGGPRPHINKVKQLFQTAFPSVPIIKTNSTTAEMVKYFTNIQLAARVVLSCELAQVCEKLDEQGLDIDYDKVQEYACYDKRLGGSHMNVPGADGIAGSRGHCFPKDLAALVFLSKKLNIAPNLMEAIQQKNLAIVPREHRDWEQMLGRAISKNK